MSIYSNDNIRKIAKLTTRELPQKSKNAKITVRENNGLYSIRWSSLLMQLIAYRQPVKNRVMLTEVTEPQKYNNSVLIRNKSDNNNINSILGTDPERNAPRKQSTQWSTLECHNRTRAKLSSLRSVCFVRRLLVLLPNFVVVIEHKIF